ncbi:MAG: NADP-dependent 3-hydroxy acid dehydrogenase YdfG [Candidatus Azotimanducaceae bacterium]|jgi:NADP-dependent 3-hydroxy acid dehydrogenase YdfG
MQDKVIIVTGAASGFGRLVCEMCLARGASVAALDVDGEGLASLAKEIADESADAQLITQSCDVTDLAQVDAAAAAVIAKFGRIDVMINNAGTMPLAFFADHKVAAAAWSRCIDINIKGVMHGIAAVYDQMIEQGRGHIINLSSIYGNFPVAGAGVYGATKSAVNFLSESLRVEAQGKIKVTTVKPTGVPATNLGGGIVNDQAIVGILGQNTESYLAKLQSLASGQFPPEQMDPNDPQYMALDPSYIAQAIVDAIAQPWGVTTSEITVRATGDEYVL